VVLRPLFEALPQAEGMAAPWRVPAAAGLLIGIGLRGRLREGTALAGHLPHLSGDQARQTVAEQGEDCLIGGARRQKDRELGFRFDNLGGDFDQAQPQGIELHHAPDRTFGHDATHRPQEPVGAGVQEQAKLVGLGRMAGSAVGGEVVLPRLDVVFGLAAGAIEALVEVLGAAGFEVGDDKAGVGSRGPNLDAGDDALDPAPASGSVIKLREAAHLAAGGRRLEAFGSAFFERRDMAREGRIGSQAEDPIDLVCPAPVEHFRGRIMAVGARQLARGDKALVGNTGYRRFIKTQGPGRFAIDHAKAEADARFDGVFVLDTNAGLDPLQTMLRYKQLWTVEAAFRTAKHLFASRPIYHKLDATIRGHVFCSFLALLLKSALDDRIAGLGESSSWPAILADPRLADRDRDRAGWRPLAPACRSQARRQSCLPRRRSRPAGHGADRHRRLITSRSVVPRRQPGVDSHCQSMPSRTAL
jgi:hypothetical protein